MRGPGLGIGVLGLEMRHHGGILLGPEPLVAVFDVVAVMAAYDGARVGDGGGCCGRGVVDGHGINANPRRRAAYRREATAVKLTGGEGGVRILLAGCRYLNPR
nr:hypothetical protein GCM10025699_22050 [Microbacterium flavescens]